MQRYESDYSDDFEEEELSSAAAASSKPSAGSLYYGGGGGGPSLQRRKRREQPVAQEKERYRGEKFTTPSRRTVVTGPPPSKSRSTGAVSTRTRRGFSERGAGRRSFLPRRLETGAKTTGPTTGASPARDRQLSAMNHKVRGLQNRVAERERELEEVSKENKLLNRLQKKQDKEWTRIQRQEDELPHILSRHEGEVKALRQQLRKSHDQVLAGQKQVGELQDEARRLAETNSKLEAVVGRRKLLERDRLTAQLQQVSEELTEKEKRVADLERGLEASGKTHAQEIKGLRGRNRALASEAASLRDNVEKLTSLLKEKTREMEVMNIYTQRIPRSLPRAPSPPPPPSLPLPCVTHTSSQTTLSCPPFKSVSMQHRSQLKTAASQTDVGTSQPHRAESSTQTEMEKVNNPVAEPPPAHQVPMNTESKREQPTERAGEERIGEAGGGKDERASMEAQRSKDELLQRLRELDGQKTAPASNPLSPSTVRTSVPPRSRPKNPTPPSAPQPVVSEPLAELADREQERKRLLLAKLMAIDEGGNPNNVKSVPQQSTRALVAPANKGSSSSLNSWPEVVENMHQGRPAHASEDDPFGSRSRLSGRRRERGVEGDREHKTFLTESGGKGLQTEYKPSFGRRANHTDPAPNNKPRPLPGSGITSDQYIPEAAPSISRGGLLPRRPKVDTTAMRSHDVMPGSVQSDPDDIEELVL